MKTKDLKVGQLVEDKLLGGGTVGIRITEIENLNDEMTYVVGIEPKTKQEWYLRDSPERELVDCRIIEDV